MSSESFVKENVALQSEPFLYTPSGTNGAHGNGFNTDEGKAHLERVEREAHERGLREGEQRAHAVYDAKAADLQASISQALQTFQQERELYFSRIETEVVQLALAIARKILHRESQIDPLLLTGLVHVALEKLDAGTRVRLRANPTDVHFWNEYFAQHSTDKAPELVGDPALKLGECMLETEVGSTQISLETQLKEIEQGFFDLLEQRPKGR